MLPEITISSGVKRGGDSIGEGTAGGTRISMSGVTAGMMGMDGSRDASPGIGVRLPVGDGDGNRW